MQESNLNLQFFEKISAEILLSAKMAKDIVVKKGRYGSCPDSVTIEEEVKNKQLKCIKHSFLLYNTNILYLTLYVPSA